MKIRSSLVSNSSSSSFVLSTKKNKLEEVEFQIKCTMADIGGVVILSNMKEVVQHISDEYSWCFTNGDETVEEYVNNPLHQKDDYDEIITFYKQCVNALNNGEKIIYGNVSNDSGEDFEAYLLSRGFKSTESEDFKVIMDAEH